MAFQWIEYEYPIENQFEKMIVWVDSTCRLYFSMKQKETDDWTFYSGTSTHGLGAGSTLVNRGNSESSAQTNYWSATPDSKNRVIAVLPVPEMAKYVRLHIDDTNDAPTQIYEFKPSTSFVADEILSGQLTITDDFNSPPIIRVSSGGKDRIKIGDLGNTFGIIGYDDNSATIFELSASTQQIAGFYFSSDVIASGGITFNSRKKSLSVNSTIFNNNGIQLEWNSGLPRFYAGNGATRFFKYDGSNISWQGVNTRLTNTGTLEVSNLQADGGNIAGWEITATKLRSSSSGRRIELNEPKDRISIFDAVGNEKIAMGYLEGLTTNASPSLTWGSDDYGFYAAPGDHLKIDGNATYFSGDWIIKHDAAYKILDASDNEIVRLGTNSGKKGLFVWSNVGTLLAEYHAGGFLIGDTTKTDNYIKYTTASGLVIQGGITVKGTPNLPLDTNLVGFWAFDEEQGNIAIDYSGNDNNGTIVGTPIWTTGVSGKAIDFDGTNDYVKIPTSVFNQDEGSWSAWINPDQLASSTRIFNSIHSSGINYEFRTNYNATDNSIEWIVGDTTGTVWNTYVASPVTASWQFVCFTWEFDSTASKTFLKAYKNGEYERQASFPSKIVVPDSEIRVGRWTTQYFDGKIDELRLYNKSLTATEINALYLFPSGNKPQVVGGAQTPWAHPNDVTKIDGGKIYTQSITTDQLAANAVHASQMYIQKLSAISANVGSIDSGYIHGVTIVGGEIKTASAGHHITLDSYGMALHVTATIGKYGTFKYAEKKYGSGALAYIHHNAHKVPFYISAEQDVADFHFYNRSDIPTGEAEIGDVCCVDGTLKICTAGGTPGTWESIGPSSGSGDVIGPSSSTDSGIVLFNGTTGKVIKDSTRLIEDTLTDGNNIPDGHAIITYGDGNWGTPIDVRNYGAVGDGVTDDTNAINNAITAVLTSGTYRALYFPPGKYRVTSTLSFNTNTLNYLTILGAGSKSQIYCDVDGVTIFKIDLSAGSMYYGNIHDLMLVSGSTSISVTGIEITSGTGDYYFSNNIIHNVHFINLQNGILNSRQVNTPPENHSDWNIISGCSFRNCAYGMKFETGSGTGNIITSCTFVPRSSTGYSIYYDGYSSTYNVGDIIITGCQFATGGAACIHLSSTALYKNRVSVTGCQFDGSAGVGIEADGYSKIYLIGNNWGGATTNSLTSCTEVTEIPDENYYNIFPTEIRMPNDTAFKMKNNSGVYCSALKALSTSNTIEVGGGFDLVSLPTTEITGNLTISNPLGIGYGGTGASTASGARTNLGLGSIATQDSNSVSISGGSISGISLSVDTNAYVNGTYSAIVLQRGGVSKARLMAYSTGDTYLDYDGVLYFRAGMNGTNKMYLTPAGSLYLYAGSVDAYAGYKVNGTAGVSGSFTTTDGKTVTVTGGIITSIV